MTKNIFALADQFEGRLTKTAGKQRLSRSRISKSLDKAKAEYAKLKDCMDVLEANDAKLKGQLDGTRKSVQDARAKIMKMHKAMQNMDLANANDAIFYDGNSADDIGYVINGKEFHLDINDAGEVSLTPMNKFRKSRKEDGKKDENCVDENCSDDSHGHQAKETKDENEADDKKDKKDEDEGEDFDSLYASLVE